MLARLERLLDDARLVQDGQRHVDGRDVLALEEVVEGLALDGGAVKVDCDRGGVPGGGSQGLGGPLRPRVDGLEAECGVGFDGGEVFCAELVTSVKRGLSSKFQGDLPSPAKMPAPSSAIPTMAMWLKLCTDWPESDWS